MLINFAKFQEVNKYSCLVCLETSEMMVWLYQVHDKEHTVAWLYRYCTGLEVEDSEQLPQYLCEDCYLKLEEARKIKHKSIKSHFVLNDLFGNKKGPAVSRKIRIDDERIKQKMELQEENVCVKPEIVQDPEEPYEIEMETIVENFDQEIPTTTIETVEEYVDSPVELVPVKYKPPKRIKNLPNKFYCELCKREIFTEKFHHIQSHKRQGLKPEHQCIQCKKHFYLSGDLIMHSCTSSFKVCEPCNINFTTVEEFKRHLEDFHKDEGGYQCWEESCDVVESHVTHFYHHIKYHKYPGMEIY